MANCFHCEIEIKRKEKWTLKCFICGLISHLKCANVSETDHNVITNMPCINYTCKTCTKAEFMLELKKVRTSLDNVKKKLNYTKLTNLENKLYYYKKVSIKAIKQMTRC
ncbi:hypothetical protein WA026_011244 [Henosepilachna vigintioctopunctata]|uniref:Zinc finger PHD-type domain-containing protein n=1 Tax=Henosepilachna vigintioctopunctata TaxID=420089 RepID=A0AAW1U635_9CUCU